MKHFEIKRRKDHKPGLYAGIGDWHFSLNGEIWFLHVNCGRLLSFTIWEKKVDWNEPLREPTGVGWAP